MLPTACALPCSGGACDECNPARRVCRCRVSGRAVSPDCRAGPCGSGHPTSHDQEAAMSERFDAVVLGMGPAGEAAASRLLGQGLKVAVVERELIGGECAYWACIPSKTLLRAP